MNSTINSMFITSAQSRAILGLSLACGIGLMATSSMGFAAIPLAATEVSMFCEVQAGGYAFDQTINVAEPFAQATACNLTTSGTYWGEPVNAHAEGYASAGFGPGIPQIGLATVSAQISTYDGKAEAIFGASTQYFFEIQPISTVPGTAPALLPVLFSAHGEGSSGRSGYGISRSQGVVNLVGNGLSYPDGYSDFYFEVVDETAYDPIDEEYLGGGFDTTKFLNLYSNSTYQVVLSASCYTWAAPVGQSAAASVGCFAQVDPFITFNQAAFDAQMGENTFRLDEYYTFVYSQNLPIPEPEPYAMMLAGLGLVGFAARRRWTFNAVSLADR